MTAGIYQWWMVSASITMAFIWVAITFGNSDDLVAYANRCRRSGWSTEKVAWVLWVMSLVVSILWPIALYCLLRGFVDRLLK